MKVKLPFLERVFTIASLIHFSGGGIPLIVSGGFSEGDGVASNATNPINASVFILIYLATASLLALRWKKVISAISGNKFISIFLLLAICSFSWSLYPVTTLVESIRVFAAALFGLYFATRFSIKEQIEILGRMFSIILLLSIAMAILQPQYGLMGGVHSGAFRGIYVHKNQFGLTACIGAIIFLIRAANSSSKAKLAFYLYYALSIFLILLSRSTSALGISILISALFFVFYSHVILRWRYLYMVPVGLSMTVLGTWIFRLTTTHFATVTGAIGKDATLTGRSTFWPIIINMIAQQPWLGYGIAGFWNGLEGPSRQVMLTAMWDVPEAHNGFLELTLALGTIGLSIFCLTYFLSFLRAISFLRSYRQSIAVWPILYLSFIVLSNLTESSLLGSGFIWLIYVSVCFSLPLQHHHQQSQSPSPRRIQQQVLL